MYRLRGYCNCGRVIEDVSVRDVYECVCVCVCVYVYYCADGVFGTWSIGGKLALFAAGLRHVTLTSLSIRRSTVISFEMQRAIASENCGQSRTESMTADYRNRLYWVLIRAHWTSPLALRGYSKCYSIDQQIRWQECKWHSIRGKCEQRVLEILATDFTQKCD